jgi:hypothetical protein
MRARPIGWEALPGTIDAAAPRTQEIRKVKLIGKKDYPPTSMRVSINRCGSTVQNIDKPLAAIIAAADVVSSGSSSCFHRAQMDPSLLSPRCYKKAHPIKNPWICKSYLSWHAVCSTFPH